VPLLSRASRLLLLERAVLAVAERYGMPETEPAQRFFDAEVDALYRQCLVAQRKAPPQSFGVLARQLILQQMTAAHGAAHAVAAYNTYVNNRAQAIAAGLLP
jgi:hypothetical protein